MNVVLLTGDGSELYRHADVDLLPQPGDTLKLTIDGETTSYMVADAPMTHDWNIDNDQDWIGIVVREL